MATLDPGNIVNGNTIEPNDLLQLYQAFGTGSGASITGLKMTGSLNGNAVTSTTATSASNITTAITGGSTWYPTFVDGAGTRPAKIDNDLEYDATNNILTVTASYATTASYASNAVVSSIQGNYDTGIVQTGAFKFVAGRVAMSTGAATSSAFPQLAGKVIGTNAWITANYQNGAMSGDILMVTSISSSGEILFDGFTGQPASATVIFTGFYI